MLRFHASTVDVYAADDPMTVVLFHGEGEDGREHSVELQLLIRWKGDSPYPHTRVALTEPRAAGKDCVTRAELRRDSFRIMFGGGGRLAKVGEAQITFDLTPRGYRQLEEGLVEVFAGSGVFRIAEE